MNFLQKITLALCVCIPGTAMGCLWDSDTLATESARFPGTAGMIGGNFPRHSKEYHEWRVNQKKALVDAGKAAALDFDDLAVSQHKQGDHRAAINTMLAKEKQTPGIYETYSNLGTFYIYTGDLNLALQYIDKALSINPDAHFGREKYQRWLVMWMLERKNSVEQEQTSQEKRASLMNGDPMGFAAFIARQKVGGGVGAGVQTPAQQFTESQRQSAIQGVTGMMYFADFDNPLLLEALADLLRFGHPNINASQLAALAYLQASQKAVSPEEKARLKGKLKEALRITEQRKESEYERILAIGLKEGQKLNEQVRTDEIAWIAAGQNATVEFQKKYLQTEQ